MDDKETPMESLTGQVPTYARDRPRCYLLGSHAVGLRLPECDWSVTVLEIHFAASLVATCGKTFGKAFGLTFSEFEFRTAFRIW